MKNLHLGAVSAIALAVILAGCVTPQYTYKSAERKHDQYGSSSVKSSDEQTAMVATPVKPELTSTKCFSIFQEGTKAAALFVALPFLYANTWRKGTTDIRSHGGLGCGMSFMGVSIAIPLFVAGVVALVPAAGCSVYELMIGQRYIPKLQKTPPPILIKSSDSDRNKTSVVMDRIEVGAAVPVIVVALPAWAVGFTWALSFVMVDWTLSAVLRGSGDASEEEPGPAHGIAPNTSATLERHELSPKHRP